MENLDLARPVYERNRAAVIMTGMQWMDSEKLLISYREHGVQSVLRFSLCHSFLIVMVRLWDTKKGTMIRYIVQPQTGL